MPVVNFYLSTQDAKDLFQFFNAQQELAYLTKGENHDWKAVHKTEKIESHLLWLISSGHIIEIDHTLKDIRRIEKPFDGWTQELRQTISESNITRPYAPKISFGDHIFDFTFYPMKDGVLGLSSIEWFGVGSSANASCKKYWQKLNRQFKKMMQEEIPRSNYPKSKLKALCFPNAFNHIQSGGKRASNPGNYWQTI